MVGMDYITKVVDRLIRKHGTRDPFEICRALDIEIYYRDLGAKAKALYYCDSRVRFIALNNRITETILRILLWHELGHDQLHQDIIVLKGFRKVDAISLSIPVEYEANLFAAEAVISDDDVMDLLQYDDRTFYSMAKELYVPYPLLEFKLRIMQQKGHDIQAPFEANGDFLKNAIAGCFEDEW